jgi:hypothetical protein
MVAEGAKNKVFSGFNSTYGAGTDVTITDKSIESSTTVDGYQLVIAPATVTSDAYTIKFGNKFLSWTSGNSLNGVDSESENANWKISFDATSQSIYIVNAKDNTRKIRWNNSSPRFACYTTAQTDVFLYKLAE